MYSSTGRIGNSKTSAAHFESEKKYPWRNERGGEQKEEKKYLVGNWGVRGNLISFMAVPTSNSYSWCLFSFE
jgi:hypothetical protein